MKTPLPMKTAHRDRVFHVSTFFGAVAVIATIVAVGTQSVFRLLGAEDIAAHHRAAIWLAGVVAGLFVASWRFESHEVSD